ncbi:alpha/beta fold hydrolase [Haloferula sp. BvORR071]|uniref:alpha/beta hydrolase family protein n=1 Tax=Haloferula sp. BvORR071 TaxID=1396141 RepID=UPI00054D9CB5|nr:alpha/beta fold hydrolase [Haloferula sp. BvORR071]
MKRFRRIALRSAAVALILLLILFAVVGWFGSEHMVSPPRRALQDYHREILAQPDAYGLKIESYTGIGQTPCLLVTPSQQPGKAEKSRILRAELEKRGVAIPIWGEQTGTVVLLYGHGGRKEDHLPICERFCAAGFRCILIDLPGQGDHPALCSTFGVREAALVEKLFDEASSRFAFMPAPAFLFGVSQGGAIALQTAARNPGKWQGVASIATFSSLDRPVLRSTEEMTPNCLHFCCPLAALSVSCGTRLRAGFWPANVRPVEAAAKLSLPTFIAHGDQDPYIGIDQAREIFAAIPASKKQFRVVEGADHNHVLSKGSHALYADLCQFFLEAADPAQAAVERTE